MSSEDLAERLEADVLAGRWKPGERLPSERQLAESLLVSRPAVREALRRLQERGLIAVVAGRGSFVRELRPTEGSGSLDLLARRGAVTARQLIVARTMLECEAARLAAQHHTSGDARRMKQILDAFDATEDVALGAELDVAFHESIAVASGNPVIQIMFGSIRNLTHALVLRSLTDRHVRNIGAPLHGVVLAAILDRDGEAARRGMAEHLQMAERFYGLDLDQPLATVLHRRAARQPQVADLLRRVGQSLEAGAAGAVRPDRPATED